MERWSSNHVQGRGFTCLISFPNHPMRIVDLFLQMNNMNRGALIWLEFGVLEVH